MAYRNTMAFHWHFLFSSEGTSSFFKVQSHLLRRSKLLLEVLWQFLVKTNSSIQKGPIPLSYRHINP